MASSNMNDSPYSLALTSYLITYIIDDYNPSVRIIRLVSNTTYVVYVNCTHKLRDLQFKDFLRNLSWQFYLLSEFLPEKC